MSDRIKEGSSRSSVSSECDRDVDFEVIDSDIAEIEDNDYADPSKSPPKKKKRLHSKTVFNREWSRRFPCIQSVKGQPHKAHCTVSIITTIVLIVIITIVLIITQTE